MKHTFIITIIFFLFFQNSFSQENDNLENGFIIKVMPLSIIDVSPRFRLGLEYVANNKLAYSIDFGIGNSSINSLNIWRIGGDYSNDYSFYEIRPEIKYLFIKTKKYYVYSSIEFFYMELDDFKESGSYEKENSNIETFYDGAMFHKQKYGVHLKLGQNIIAYKSFNFDFYIGLGVAVRTFNYTDVINPVDGEESIFVEWVPKPYLFEGTTVIPHLALGFKLGYTI